VEVPLAEAMKRCPECQEKVQLMASRCRHCGHQFTEEEMAQAGRIEAENKRNGRIAGFGCLGLLGFFGLVGALGGGGESAPDPKQAAATAEDRRKGFHCLSKWDGSSEQLVEAVKTRLRDPDSFEHDETRILPVKDGKHGVTMQYRARNGFGGMNRTVAVAEIDHATCGATVLTLGE
jgi:hypothetical protein